MKILVTGSAGHLGEALIRVLQPTDHEIVGIDVKASPFTDEVISITNRKQVKRCMQGVDAVLHTATLHKPHVATHTRQAFVDTNISGTLNLLEEAAHNKVKAFIYTSTTSVFGRALRPSSEKSAVWVTEDLVPIPRNIYGVTKFSSEQLCRLFHFKFDLPCIVLRTSRFFPEEDDRKNIRDSYDDSNSKVNEFLYRRAEISDIVDAHLLALDKANNIGFGLYIISATTPFTKQDVVDLRKNPAKVVSLRAPGYEDQYALRNWHIFSDIERIYVNEKAREDLGWRPRYDFHYIIDLLKQGKDFRSPLAVSIGQKGYHKQKFREGPFPVDE
ncbi:NAD-dependent epimerase/dehydratase family protein [Candidatus Uabimicrobium sp. HlEnr_7]|uniref:NAD-dependent epimerase/dehydratase family protein n=1 Tax=Candidatus Uabimicrobium helgolandensis TaxID=3095367 RepID=UPI003557A8DC